MDGSAKACVRIMKRLAVELLECLFSSRDEIFRGASGGGVMLGESRNICDLGGWFRVVRGTVIGVLRE